MVKRENPNFSLPPLRDVPPGFQPHPPKPCTSASASAAAAAAAGQCPNSYRQKPPPPPTSLKRPDGPRRRGRPPKARSFSHLYAVRSSDEGKRLVDERNRRLKNIDKEKREVSLRKAEMEKLKSEIRDLEDRLVQEAVLVDELNKKISARTTRFSQLQNMYVVDGLV
ncbi:hypothetical protein MIMGU_mgv1a015172mg [Erythranthe guttata]|uniref:Uncharacterized protein n=1 Tax=Erythranthe guttata TaxID=4155 RepID=A0A022RF05_ERYGU|nr:hypothetical protein MIMGU_mgv1a015172mg [Erythranthe guttata]